MCEHRASSYTTDAGEQGLHVSSMTLWGLRTNRLLEHVSVTAWRFARAQSTRWFVIGINAVVMCKNFKKQLLQSEKSSVQTAAWPFAMERILLKSS